MTAVLLPTRAARKGLRRDAVASGWALSYRPLYAADLAHCQEIAVSRDGVRISVMAQIDAAADAAQALALGAEGCGLLRSESLFSHCRAPPTEAEQAAAYQAMAQAFDGRVFTLGAFDTDGHTPSWLCLPKQTNPALGWRGIRLYRRYPELLRTQLAALLALAERIPCRVLLSMVNDADDLTLVRVVLADLLTERDLPASAMPAVGALIETPAAALRARQILDYADFVTIDSNDLTQYTLALDRRQAAWAADLEGLHPAVLSLIGKVVSAARSAEKPVALCGALAADATALPVMLGLNLTEIIVAPQRIPQTKAQIRKLHLPACREWAQSLLTLPSARAARQAVQRACR